MLLSPQHPVLLGALLPRERRKCRPSGPLLQDPDAATELLGGALVFESLTLERRESWRETPAQGRNEPKEPS